ncbi:MAG: hypothetical protein Q9209_001701 [Squamulea sp. 1 TL-2023]
MPHLEFLQLPIDVRLIIYSYLLTSSSSISVWPATTLCGQGSPAESVPRSTIWNLSLGLLQCNSIIAREAATVFYGGNTFRIHSDDWDYRLIVHWLKQIGSQNRAALRWLEVRIWKPKKAWQLSNGTRLGRLGQDDCYLPHPHLAVPSLPCPEGAVDIIDPLIETIIALVSQSGGRKLQLYLKVGLLDLYTIPGIESARGQEAEDGFSMDLPNLIENWRTKYILGGHGRNVEILWNTSTDNDFFLNIRTIIEQRGWQIVWEHNDAWMKAIEYPTREPTKPSIIQLLLKRTELITMPAAADPYPMV